MINEPQNQNGDVAHDAPEPGARELHSTLTRVEAISASKTPATADDGETPGDDIDDVDCPFLPVRTDDRELTSVEKKVLKVLMNPQLAEKTNLERIEASGVGKTSYYRVLRDPWFKQQQHAAFREMIRHDLGAIIAAMVTTAKQPGRDSHNDRRLAFELCGIYTPRQHVQLDAAPRHVVGVVGVSMDEL